MVKVGVLCIKNTERKIKESYDHMKDYLDDLECTEELRDMCKHCERYCGKEHNYEHCKDMMCFKFYLAFEYLEWSGTYE